MATFFFLSRRGFKMFPTHCLVFVLYTKNLFHSIIFSLALPHLLLHFKPTHLSGYIRRVRILTHATETHIENREGHKDRSQD